MKELKFRAWHKDNKFMIKNIKLLNDLVDKKSLIFMQFTGLKDKNGKEIFGGDIVETVTDDRFSGEVGIVFRDEDGCWKFDKECNGYMASKVYDLQDIIKVIGNIHRNPELLEEGK